MQDTKSTNGEIPPNGIHVNGEVGKPEKPLMGPDQPLPHVSEFDFSTAASPENLVDDIVSSLRVSGGCVIRNMVGKDVLDQLEADIRPHLNAAKPAPGTFWPPQTRKVMGCMGKSKAFANHIVGNPIWQKIGEHFLTSRLEWNWVGDKREQSVAGPQLNNTVVFSIGPGGYAQVLHRDDPVHHNFHPAAAEHHLGRDTAVGFFVAGTKTTRANGATRFVPGSHLWDYSLPPPSNDDKCFYAELEPGDGFIVMAGCYHGGSANTTADEERLVYSTFSTRGWCRQEENQYLANDVEKIKELPVWLQRFMGYSLSRPFMGWVDMDDPMKVINPDYQTEGDLW